MAGSDRPRAPTIREVASAAGLDISTVSRALRPETQRMVKPETLKRVLAAADALGYRANPFARGLKDQKSMTIGMLVPDLGNPLFPPIVRGIEDGLRDRGYVMILGNTDQDLGREKHLIDVFMQRRVDGLVLATARRDYPLVDVLSKSGVPVVLVNRTVDDASMSMVAADDHQGIGLSVKHLVEQGHRRIAFVGAALEASTGFNRYQHFLAWMQTLGQTVDKELIVFAPWFTKDYGAEATAELLARDVDFTAIIAPSDMIALGCYRALRAKGLEVPKDVSVVGYNGSRWCDEFNPPLTSIHVPKYDIGRETARLMLNLLDNPDAPPSRVLLPTSLQVRASTRLIR
ncbi:LacI family transcriptional regulator [Mycolicibacterium agri]|uniref:LacI family transcriptional regulator n=1 Tax=Mycolicibacterium agri TaxID=36811 RepID=A0A2A7NEC4_MYCAG|nr:LacI family DNA-binding transcriptional regulator [Mycolicibacterium agri]PEG42284.1 LacI family transcriptional regulator [Mycolicibacterium agri]GFG51131.1 LacI family transcriptional regulator [Mycolicibacterium agri]